MNISNIIKVVEEISSNSEVIAAVSAKSPKAGAIMKAVPLILALLKEGHIDASSAAMKVAMLAGDDTGRFTALPERDNKTKTS